MSEETAITQVAPPTPEQQAADERATKSALALRFGDRGVMFSNVDEAVKYATACWNSRLLPEHIKTPSQAFVIMDNGRELGLKPWGSWKLIYVTKQGRITIMSKGALAIAQASPRYESYTEKIEFEGTKEMRAVAVAKTKGMAPVEKTFSLADAETAGLLKKKRGRDGSEYDGPWQAYLKDMLLARARDRALAIAFAAELAGIELETMAEDADRLEEGKPAPPPESGVRVASLPAGAEASEHQRALPEGKTDPAVAFLMGGANQIPTRDIAQGQQKEPQRNAGRADEAGQKPAAGSGGEAPPSGRTGELPEGEARAEIEKSVDEALPAPKKKGKTKAEKAVTYKVGDIIRDGTRRVTEVDAEGRIVEVEKLSAAEVEELRAKSDPTRPPWPAHKEDDGSWYCDAHNAYGCAECGRAREEGAEQKPKNCPREWCGKPLNLYGDCDSCGWPRATFR